MTAGLGSGELGDLEQVPVRVAKERTRLAVANVRCGEEIGAPIRQKFVEPDAVVNAEDELRGRVPRIGRLNERHTRFARIRTTTGDEENPTSEQLENN